GSLPVWGRPWAVVLLRLRPRDASGEVAVEKLRRGRALCVLLWRAGPLVVGVAWGADGDARSATGRCHCCGWLLGGRDSRCGRCRVWHAGGRPGAAWSRSRRRRVCAHGCRAVGDALCPGGRWCTVRGGGPGDGRACLADADGC